MALSAQQQSKLDCLLLQREALYARIYTIETQINAILGQAYPFSEPPEPIASGAPMPKPRPQSKTTTPNVSLPKLRSLEGNESAYRVRFLQDNSPIEETHTDRKSLQNMLQGCFVLSLIHSIETVREDHAPGEILWQNDLASRRMADQP